ncbi:endonuclease [Candidatus Woesearchaeota archaeon]|nr:endonuclease [Candidatus Woesearchaeota archaeon]
MGFEEVKERFQIFEKKHGKNAFLKVDEFLEEIKAEYLKQRTKEYMDQGIIQNEAHNKARQSWRPKVGSFLESLVKYMIEEFCGDSDIKISSDKKLKKRELSKELSLLRSMMEVHFNEYSLLPDADLVLYKYNEKLEKVKVLCILSLKTSFRERFTETPYWKLKLKQDPRTEKIKVFMVTPDNTDEISYSGSNGPRKARIIMEYELDGIYMAREEFDESKKIKGLHDLFENLEEIIKEK